MTVLDSRLVVFPSRISVSSFQSLRFGHDPKCGEITEPAGAAIRLRQESRLHAHREARSPAGSPRRRRHARGASPRGEEIKNPAPNGRQNASGRRRARGGRSAPTRSETAPARPERVTPKRDLSKKKRDLVSREKREILFSSRQAHRPRRCFFRVLGAADRDARAAARAVALPRLARAPTRVREEASLPPPPAGM